METQEKNGIVVNSRNLGSLTTCSKISFVDTENAKLIFQSFRHGKLKHHPLERYFLTLLL